MFQRAILVMTNCFVKWKKSNKKHVMHIQLLNLHLIKKYINKIMRGSWPIRKQDELSCAWIAENYVAEKKGITVSASNSASKSCFISSNKYFYKTAPNEDF